jgi:hypothetical protein
MPSFLIGIIVNLAIRFGMAALVKRFPGIPPEVIAVIEQLLKILSTPGLSREQKKEAEKKAKKRVKDVCNGVACETDLK